MARKDSFNKTWASNPAQFEKPGDALIERGWAGGASEDPPEAKWENWWHNRLDEALLEIQNSGALAWFSDAKYTKGALVNYGGKNWVALSTNSNISPNGPLDNGIWLEVEYSKSDFLKKSQNGADIPDKNAFVKNLGLSETVELAKNAVPSSRKINGKALSRDINITSQDIFDEPVTIHENADLNTYRTGGLYYQPSSAWAVTGKNYPRGAAGSLIVLRGGYTQRYCVIGSSESYIRGYYDSLGWSAWAKEYNSENPQPPDIPIGVPLPYPHRYTPPGYLTCNGQTFNKSVYPKLAEAYPAGRVPDLRGEFIRGWDDSRGVDPGRVCGTWQADCIPDHNHYKVASKQLVEDLVLTGDAGWYTSSGSSTRTRSLDQNTYTGGVTEAQVIANETRPRNIAFNYIVRAV